MSQDLRSRPVRRESVDALDDVGDYPAYTGRTLNLGFGSLLDHVWRFFISMRTGLWLILVLGLLSLAGTLLEQAPAAVRNDPAAYAQWVDGVSSTYGGWTKILSFLGLFGVFSSYWFKGITILLATSILACSVNRAPKLWKVATHPRPSMGRTFYDHAPLRADVVVDEDPEKALADITTVLHRHRFRVIQQPEDDGRNLYADRYRWGPFGTVLAHVSFVLILLGFLLTATTGFKDEGFVAPVGQTVDVGHSTGLSILTKSFTETDYANGMPKDYAADLVLYKNGKQVQHQVVRVNHPMTQDGVWIYQSSFGIAASMVVKDAQGAVLADVSPALFQSTDNQHIFGSFTIPSQDLTVFVVEPASGQTDPAIKAGQVQLEIHKGQNATPLAVQVISQGKAQTIDGLSYTFDRNRQYTGLIVAHDRGQAFVWVGSALFVLGLVLVFFFPHRRIWIRAHEVDEGTEIRCASTVKRDPAFEPQFHQMITEIQQAGVRPSDSTEGAENDA